MLSKMQCKFLKFVLFKRVVHKCWFCDISFIAWFNCLLNELVIDPVKISETCTELWRKLKLYDLFAILEAVKKKKKKKKNTNIYDGILENPLDVCVKCKIDWVYGLTLKL